MKSPQTAPNTQPNDLWAGALVGLKILFVIALIGKAVFDAGSQGNYWIFLAISALLGGFFVYHSNRSRGIAAIGMALATSAAIFLIAFPACWSVGCVASFS